MLHILTDSSVVAFEYLELKLALRGMSRLHPHCPKQATPITPYTLLSIKVTLDLNKTEHIVYWSLFLLACFTFARKSNLVPANYCQLHITTFNHS